MWQWSHNRAAFSLPKRDGAQPTKPAAPHHKINTGPRLVSAYNSSVAFFFLCVQSNGTLLCFWPRSKVGQYRPSSCHLACWLYGKRVYLVPIIDCCSRRFLCCRPADGVDDTLWWFKAGSDYSGNLGVAYAGTLEFSIGSFSGTFSEGLSRHARFYSLTGEAVSRMFDAQR